MAGRRRLVGIGEDAQPVEFGRAHEIAQLAEIGFGLAGETDDERGAQRYAGNRAPDAFDEFQERAAVRAALACCSGMSR